MRIFRCFSIPNGPKPSFCHKFGLIAQSMTLANAQQLTLKFSPPIHV